MELGVQANRGERIVLNLDFVSMLGSVGAAGGSGVPDFDDPQSVRTFLEDSGFDFSTPVPVDAGGVADTLAGLLGLDGVDLSGLGTVNVDSSAAFDALYPALRASLVINQVRCVRVWEGCGIIYAGLDTHVASWWVRSSCHVT